MSLTCIFKVSLGNKFCYDLMLLCWIPVNATCIIVILGTLWMLFPLYWTLNQNNFPINLGTLRINCFLPKLLESYGTIWHACIFDKKKMQVFCTRHVRNQHPKKSYVHQFTCIIQSLIHSVICEEKSHTSIDMFEIEMTHTTMQCKFKVIFEIKLYMPMNIFLFFWKHHVTL